jgi:hypothetical protein
MGLLRQEFRTLDRRQSLIQVIVHPDDLAETARRPFTLRGDMVEFVEES